MKQHDPYGSMLAELRRLNDANTEEQFQESLRLSQPYVTSLRQAYKASPSDVDFSCPHIRAAYLLAYYPYYIEPLYEILCQLSPDIVRQAFGRKEIIGLFLGAGPAPEVLGLIAFLNDHVPDVKMVVAYLLDKYIHDWRIGQELTSCHLAPLYWSRGQVTVHPLEFDFLDPKTLEDPFVLRAMEIFNLVVMQNCLNDQLGNRQAVLEMLKNIFAQTEPGTLFVISDLNYPAIRDLILELGEFVQESGLGEVLLPVQECATRLCSHIEVPPVILEHLLIGDEARNLIPRKYTYFYSAVFQRVVEEIPF